MSNATVSDELAGHGLCPHRPSRLVGRDKQVITMKREEQWWGGMAVVGPLSMSEWNSSGFESDSRRKGRGKWDKSPQSEGSAYARGEAQENGECGKKKEVQYRSSTGCDTERVKAGRGEMWMPSGCWASRNQLEKLTGHLSFHLYIQWRHVGRRKIYSPEIDKDTDDFSFQAWEATVMMLLFTQVRNTRMGPPELPFEYVKVEVLGNKVGMSGRQLDIWIRLFLSDHTAF